MKVWVASYWYDYESPDHVIGVFSSKEKAEEALQLCKDKGDWRDVNEYVLDQIDE
jgi:hypothetical protein